MSDARTNQLAEIWRVGIARKDGNTKAELAEIAGPLSAGSMKIGLRILKEMFVGKQYAMTMPPGDTEYFLNRINEELDPSSLDLAFRSIDQHLNNYINTNGNQPLIREVYDRWLAKSGAITTLEAHLAQESAALATALVRTQADRAARLAAADPMPKTTTVTATVYLRNPDVAAIVLLRANGSCEACGKPAPFRKRADGTPYLEVHHRLPLAEHGPDTVANAIALCPNCHRQAHHGMEQDKFRT